MSYSATAEVIVNAPASKVWEALINPAMIKQYLFGTDAISEWKEGSSIIYRGVWEGKPYEDKGQIIKIVPDKLLHTTYWSGFEGKPDLPENYHNVIYTLVDENNTTKLTLTQDNIPTEESAKHSENNWNMVLAALKKLLENN